MSLLTRLLLSHALPPALPLAAVLFTRAKPLSLCALCGQKSPHPASKGAPAASVGSSNMGDDFQIGA